MKLSNVKSIFEFDNDNATKSAIALSCDIGYSHSGLRMTLTVDSHGLVLSNGKFALHIEEADLEKLFLRHSMIIEADALDALQAKVQELDNAKRVLEIELTDTDVVTGYEHGLFDDE